MAGPLEQFQIKPIIPLHVGGIDVTFTNSAMWMAIATVAATIFFVAGMRRRALVPGRWQASVEMAYQFVANMVRDNVGAEGRQYFPFVFGLFMFILFGNLFGLLPVPYGFTFTAQIIVTFGLAMVVFVLVTLIGIARHGLHWFTYFMPSGVPPVMAPIIVPIEFISYLSRPISLSIRLFANMMAGHTMLKVFAGFTILLGVTLGWAPVLINVALIGFEILVACLQAYVFAILTCLYLHDAIHLH